MVDWMNYSKLQEQKRKGFKKSQVARNLNINRETESVYWNMPPSEYTARIESAKMRTKKADPYKDFVVESLIKYPDMSASQIYDWIKERTSLETLEFQERCFLKHPDSMRSWKNYRRANRCR